MIPFLFFLLLHYFDSLCYRVAHNSVLISLYIVMAGPRGSFSLTQLNLHEIS